MTQWFVQYVSRFLENLKKSLPKNNFKSTHIFELDKTDKKNFYVCNLGLTLSNIFKIMLLGDSSEKKMSKLQRIA